MPRKCFTNEQLAFALQQEQIVPQQECKREEIRLGKCMGTVCINQNSYVLSVH